MALVRLSINAVLCSKVCSRLHISEQTRSVKRWVAPTLRELRVRAKKLGPQAPQPRSDFLEWNYRAELFAFSKRLQEEFQLPLLQTAFTQQSYVLQEEQRVRDLGVDEGDLQMTDNQELSELGVEIAREYLNAYFKHSLPQCPEDGRQAFAQHLLSETTLAHIASHLGMKDLIFASEYPPSQSSMAQSLCGVIGALMQSSGKERAFLFVRDFICTQLNQRDLLDLWNIENPEELLKQICSERKLPDPEPRLIGDCGKNTVLAAYNVGIYSDKQLIGKGFGEDIPTAIQTASLDALLTLFGIQENRRPFDFQVQVQPDNKKVNPN